MCWEKPPGKTNGENTMGKQLFGKKLLGKNNVTEYWQKKGMLGKTTGKIWKQILEKKKHVGKTNGDKLL